MKALPTPKQLHYLIALSEQLNFTRAAETCCVTQSTLSAGVKELEDLLEVQLVERDRQTVLMTPIGLEVASRAQAILAEIQDLVDVARETRGAMNGLIKVGVIPTIAPFLLPPAMTLLRRRHPVLRLALREDLTANLLWRLKDGRLDFALIALPYDTANFLVEPLFDDELWLVGKSTDADMLAGEVNIAPSLTDRLLLLEEGHCLRDHALYACGQPTRQAVEGVEATSLLTLIQMIESGLGIGLVPEMAVCSGLTASSSLLARPIAAPCPKRTIALAARRSTARLADFEALADVIKTSYAAATPRDEYPIHSLGKPNP